MSAVVSLEGGFVLKTAFGVYRLGLSDRGLPELHPRSGIKQAFHKQPGPDSQVPPYTLVCEISGPSQYTSDQQQDQATLREVLERAGYSAFASLFGASQADCGSTCALDDAALSAHDLANLLKRFGPEHFCFSLALFPESAGEITSLDGCPVKFRTHDAYVVFEFPAWGDWPRVELRASKEPLRTQEAWQTCFLCQLL